jgi:hypothetical protein
MMFIGILSTPTFQTLAPKGKLVMWVIQRAGSGC